MVLKNIKKILWGKIYELAVSQVYTHTITFSPQMISDNLISHFPPYKLYRGSGKQLIGAICSVSALYWQIARLGLANLVPHPHHVTKQHNYKSI